MGLGKKIYTNVTVICLSAATYREIGQLNTFISNLFGFIPLDGTFKLFFSNELNYLSKYILKFNMNVN